MKNSVGVLEMHYIHPTQPNISIMTENDARTAPNLSGFLSAKNQKLLKDTPAVFAKPYKTGSVIIFAVDMNFRSYWFGTSKLFMNAVFFNECIK